MIVLVAMGDGDGDADGNGDGDGDGDSGRKDKFYSGKARDSRSSRNSIEYQDSRVSFVFFFDTRNDLSKGRSSRRDGDGNEDGDEDGDPKS
ncbi:hypothetical protein V1477_019136 [Vespula maculifrons]|uniref:Uncharacterized protein n=1 Tax=Vespula maculifrons TaxID=7453 RepID=A0ABD2ARY9_VESMC